MSPAIALHRSVSESTDSSEYRYAAQHARSALARAPSGVMGALVSDHGKDVVSGPWREVHMGVTWRQPPLHDSAVLPFLNVDDFRFLATCPEAYCSVVDLVLLMCASSDGGFSVCTDVFASLESFQQVPMIRAVAVRKGHVPALP